MRTESWKKLFIQHGWLKGDQIVKPGYKVKFFFKGQAIEYIGNLKEATDEFLVFSFEVIGEMYYNYYLWEDLLKVTLPRDRD